MSKRILMSVNNAATLAEATDADVLNFVSAALASIIYKNYTALDADGTATVNNTSILATSHVLISPSVGVSNMQIVVTITAGLGFTLTSAGGSLDSGQVINYTILY